MKLYQIFEMSGKALAVCEQKFIERFDKLDIILTFTNHFNDRMADDAVDEHNTKRDNITEKEFMDFFQHLEKQHAKIFSDVANYQDEVRRGQFEGVIRDKLNKINVPFVLAFSKAKGKFHLTCKTIMKKNGTFHAKASDHVVEV